MFVLQEWNYFILPNAVQTNVIKARDPQGSLTYGGYRILGAAGAGTLNVYDNTAASGQKIEVSGLTIAAAADKIFTAGIACTIGLTVDALGTAPTAGLVMILWK